MDFCNIVCFSEENLRQVKVAWGDKSLILNYNYNYTWQHNSLTHTMNIEPKYTHPTQYFTCSCYDIQTGGTVCTGANPPVGDTGEPNVPAAVVVVPPVV